MMECTCGGKPAGYCRCAAPRPLEVWTARISTADPDRFDITRKSADEGIVFAPSWAILRPALDARAEGTKLIKFAQQPDLAPMLLDAYREKAAQLEADAWVAYVPAYTAEMRVSYGAVGRRFWRTPESEAAERAAIATGVRPNRAAWRTLLARPRVVLVCYCVDPEHCHRTLLAGILGKLGADVRGELPPPPPKLAPAGGMTHDTGDALRRRAARRRAG